MINTLICLTLFSALGGSHGFLSISKPRLHSPVKGSLQTLRCAASVDEILDAAYNKVSAKLGLAPNDYCESLGMHSISTGGVTGSISWWQESSPTYLTGVSKSSKCIQGNLNVARMVIWTGPSYEVPHFSLIVESDANSGGVKVTTDFIAKDDLMYAPNYVEEFYGPAVMNWWTTAHNDITGGAVKVFDSAPDPVHQARLLSSPAALSITYYPATDGSTDGSTDAGPGLQSAAAVANSAVDLWLSMVERGQPIIPRRRGAMNARDTATRRLAFAMELAKCRAIYGDAGDLAVNVAASLSGPSDEAYTGQAS